MHFLKKELKEFFSTYRVFVLFGIFLFFAFLNAPTARYMKEIFGMMGDAGFELNLPDPVFTDSYLQLFKNLQTVFIALVIVYMGTVSGEVKKGTVYLILSKGLTRLDFYLSKVVTALMMYTLAYLLSVLITVASTYALFGEWYAEWLFLSLFTHWLFGAMLVSATISVSAMANSAGYSALTGIALLIFLPLTAQIRNIGSYLPGKLLAYGQTEGLLAPAISAIIISSVFMILGAMIFKKKEL